VDDQRLVGSLGECDVIAERGPLNVGLDVVAIEIETGLADRANRIVP
jgi:hypothetical protein